MERLKLGICRCEVSSTELMPSQPTAAIVPGIDFGKKSSAMDITVLGTAQVKPVYSLACTMLAKKLVAGME